MSGFWPDPQNIDLRKELDIILRGGADMVAQGRTVILRELSDTTCSCWNKLEGGSAKPDCIYCQGEGYLWRERKLIAFLAEGVAPIYKPGFLATGAYPQAEWGFTDPDRATAYCDYRTFPNYERYTLRQQQRFDKIYDLKVKEDGSLFYPIVRTSKWKVVDVFPYRGDYSRVEFFELSLSKEITS